MIAIEKYCKSTDLLTFKNNIKCIGLEQMAGIKNICEKQLYHLPYACSTAKLNPPHESKSPKHPFTETPHQYLSYSYQLLSL